MTNYRYCYLLRSCNPKYTERTYIGVTDDYKNRLRRHNGALASGAQETELGRPWEFVAIVGGFTTDARKFEYSWQHPSESKYIKHSIGDREADLLAEKLAPRGVLVGVRGRLAVLKCLLNLEYDKDLENGNLFVEFSSEAWRSEFLKSKYIFNEDDENGVYSPSVVPSFVNPSLLSLLSSYTRKKQFPNHAFRWEMLPEPEVIEETRNEATLTPRKWRDFRSISQAILRADKRDPFQDEWREDVLEKKDYNLIHLISEQGEFYAFQLAFSKVIDCFSNNDSQMVESLDLLEKLEEAATQFNYGEQFEEYVEQHPQYQSVDFLASNFIKKEQDKIQSRAPETSRVADLFEKVRKTKAVVPTPAVADRPERFFNSTSSKRKRHVFTKEQEDDIWEGFETFGSDWERIQEEYKYSSLSDLNSNQIKDKVKNMGKKGMDSANIMQQETQRQRKKRREFTDDENDAILNGVDKYGVGGYIPWRKIIDDEAVLKDRRPDVIRKHYENKLRNNLPCIRILPPKPTKR